MRRWLPFACLVALPMGGSNAGADHTGLPVDAGSAKRQANFLVAAQVAPVVRLDSSQAPSSFTLDAADVARGFKDVEARYGVTSNLPRGYLLRFSVRDGLARRIEVHGLGAPLPLGPDGGEVWRGRTESRHAELALRYRLHVDPSLAPGRYPVPVAVSAGPL